MNTPRSLRFRLIVGSLLWTMGLLAFTHLLAILLIRHNLMNFRLRISPIPIFALGFMIAGLWQLRGGLLPFDALRKELLEVRDGRSPRIHGAYPSEVQPLVNDLNALI